MNTVVDREAALNRIDRLQSNVTRLIKERDLVEQQDLAAQIVRDLEALRQMVEPVAP